MALYKEPARVWSSRKEGAQSVLSAGSGRGCGLMSPPGVSAIVMESPTRHTPKDSPMTVSYTHLTLPTNREV